MNTKIDSIKRKLLIKYPTFGSIIANIEIQADENIQTAGTNGKMLLYNPNFLNGLTEKQQVFLFAHEICHVAFEHIYRSEGKDKRVWNIATDAVINALLQQDGLEIIEGGVDIPEAVEYDAEEMYKKLLKENQNQEQQNNQDNQEQENSQSNQEQQNSQDNQEQENSQSNQEQQNNKDNKEQGNSQSNQEQQNNQDNKEQENSQSNQEQQEENDVGHDTHSLWEKAIEERKKEQQEQNQNQEQNNEKMTNQNNNFAEQGEKEIFKQNKIERRKQLEEFSKELANKSSQQAGDGIQRDGKKLSDIGIAKQLIDWRKLLRQAVKYNEEYTRKNARMRNGYFRHKIEQIQIPETEILLDVSGSVSEVLLKNFLRECKNIIENSKVKVGCFNTEFHGFTELKRQEDIDNMCFPIGGGTDFNVAVDAFSGKVPNKIIFTDGEARMPEKSVKNVIWVVFGNEEINPKGGKVINITDKQLEKLYQPFTKSNNDKNR